MSWIYIYICEKSMLYYPPGEPRSCWTSKYCILQIFIKITLLHVYEILVCEQEIGVHRYVAKGPHPTPHPMIVTLLLGNSTYGFFQTPSELGCRHKNIDNRQNLQNSIKNFRNFFTVQKMYPLRAKIILTRLFFDGGKKQDHTRNKTTLHLMITTLLWV